MYVVDDDNIYSEFCTGISTIISIGLKTPAVAGSKQIIIFDLGIKN